MVRRILFSFAVLALAVASAKTYTLTIYQPSVFAGTELKPGDYKLDVQDTKVVLKAGKQTVESAVKVEKADAKFGSTTVRYANADGKLKVQEIRLGGTNLKLVLD